MLIRINKFLADCGVGSRRKVEEYIIQGRVSVNNQAITKLSVKINPEVDSVLLDGGQIHSPKRVYYLLNKPKGVITSTKDEKGRTTVCDLINFSEKIYPVGRLDYNTTGVLLLTNDGDFAFKLTHPKHNIVREYDVYLNKQIEDGDVKILLSGIILDKKKSRFDSIKFPKKNNKSFLRVACREGRNHFVKRMFESLGYSVKALNRISFAGIKADIPIGKYRKLSFSEVKKLVNQHAN